MDLNKFRMQLTEAFKGIRFVEDGHKYYHGEQELLSCSRFYRRFLPDRQPLNKSQGQLDFSQPADLVAYATQTSDPTAVLPSPLLDAAEQRRQAAMLHGTYIHKWIANYLTTTVLDSVPGDPEIHAFLGTWKVFQTYMTPLAIELVVGDPELGLAGTIDLVLYNEEDKTVRLLDWKTGKSELTYFNQNLRPPFARWGASALNQYGIQLGIYALILSRAFPEWKFGPPYLVHLRNDFSCYTYAPPTVDMGREIAGAVFDWLDEKDKMS